MWRKVFMLLCCVGICLADVALAGDYVIGDGDSLNISVWGAPELSVGVVVRPDGKITLPAVGDVVATGLTPIQLSQDLIKVLDAYVKKPIVTVAVSGITNNQVYISGGGVPSAVVNLTARGKVPGQRDFYLQELRLRLTKRPLRNKLTGCCLASLHWKTLPTSYASCERWGH